MEEEDGEYGEEEGVWSGGEDAEYDAEDYGCGEEVPAGVAAGGGCAEDGV